MRSLALRLLLLAAVLLMPFGMAPAPANAAHGLAHASMPMQHCPDQGPAGHLKGGVAECSMACAAALPASDVPREGSLARVSEPAPPFRAQRLHGLHPETAIPPPKQS
jgi:hypothetical protein